jgi:transposase
LKIDNIDVEAAIKNVQDLLATDKSLTAALKAALDMLLLLVTLLINQKGLNSKNSSIPPASDPNRKKGVQSKICAQNRWPKRQQRNDPRNGRQSR